MISWVFHVSVEFCSYRNLCYWRSWKILAFKALDEDIKNMKLCPTLLAHIKKEKKKNSSDILLSAALEQGFQFWLRKYIFCHKYDFNHSLRNLCQCNQVIILRNCSMYMLTSSLDRAQKCYQIKSRHQKKKFIWSL